MTSGVLFCTRYIANGRRFRAMSVVDHWRFRRQLIEPDFFDRETEVAQPWNEWRHGLATLALI